MKRRIFIFIMIIFLLTGCKEKTYTITFYNDDGTRLDSVIVNKGDTIKSYGYPEKDGYIFVSWIKDGSKYNDNNGVNDDMELIASYVPIPDIVKTYTVSFDFGNEIKTVSVKENELVTKPMNPIKSKYSFLGWYKDNELYDFDTPVTSDFTLSAKFELARVNVKLNLDGGTGIAEIEINKGDKLKIANPTKFGFNFVSWMNDEIVFDLNTPINEDIELTAKWEPKIYVRVKFDTDGGTVVLSKIIESGEKLKDIQVPEKNGYTFKYWSLHDKEFDLNTPVNESITLKAVYEVNNIDTEE